MERISKLSDLSEKMFADWANLGTANTRMMEMAIHEFIRNDPELRSEISVSPIRMVGGCVRDIIRGVKPKDIDFSTVLSPENMIEAFDRYLKVRHEVIPTGMRHGTITLYFPGTGEQYEITTLREDVSTDGRHAEVKFVTDWRADAERRDFTMNAMSINSSGVLFDYFGGYEDAVDGRVRFVGDPDKRIKEDYLRILRFYRFSARMGNLWMDGATAHALNDCQSGLEGISGERIWSELSKTMLMPNSDFILQAMFTTGFYMFGLGINGPMHVGHMTGRVMNERVRVREIPPIALLFNWLYVENGPTFLRGGITETLDQRLKFSREERDLFSALCRVNNHSPFKLKEMVVRREITVEQARIAAVVFLTDDDFDMTWVPPEFPVLGRDLITVGIHPGPMMGVILDNLRQQWVEAYLDKGKLLSKKKLVFLASGVEIDD